MLLVGSEALSFHLDINRVPKDVDLIATFDEANEWARKLKHSLSLFVPSDQGKKFIAKRNSRMIEFEIAWSHRTSSSLLELVKTDPETLYSRETLSKSLFSRPGGMTDFALRTARAGFNVLTNDIFIPSIDVLYTLKMSHRYLKDSPHFLKTMNDIRLLRDAGAKIPDRYQQWYKERQEETYNYKHPNLNQPKDGFFNPVEIQYTYDHDSIHKVMAHLDVPAYTLFQRGGAEVAVDKKKWNELPYLYKLYSVLEESYVLAIERSQVPFKGQVHPRKSFETALMKVCTSISSGWWREFAWENYYAVLDEYDPNYVYKFWKAVKEGRVSYATQ